MLGGTAPAAEEPPARANLEKSLAANKPRADPDGHRLDGFPRDRLIDPELLRADRQRRLLAFIEAATGRPVCAGDVAEQGVDFEPAEDGAEA